MLDPQLWLHPKRFTKIVKAIDLAQGAATAAGGAAAKRQWTGTAATEQELPPGWEEVEVAAAAAAEPNAGDAQAYANLRGEHIEAIEEEAKKLLPDSSSPQQRRGPSGPSAALFATLFAASLMCFATRSGGAGRQIDHAEAFAAGTLILAKDVDRGAVLLHIFRFFFTDSILERIARATNAHARQLVVEVSACAKTRASHPRPRTGWLILRLSPSPHPPTTVVQVTVNDKRVLRPVRSSDPPGLSQRARPRIANWEDTSPAELLVFFGIMIKSGTKPLDQFSYFWTEEWVVGSG
jgi:hypothetical protein